MTTLRKSVLTIACLMAAAVANAATGHIYDIRPYYDETVKTGPIASVENPMVGGDTVRFTLRFACEATKTGQNNYKWFLKWKGIGSEEVAKYAEPLKVGIFVSGQLVEARLVGGGYALSDRDYTDFIFEYTVKPGDFALPIVLALADGTPASGYAGEDVAYYVPPTSKALWDIQNENGDSANFWFGNWGAVRPQGAVASVNDYDLRGAGFYVQTVDFDDDWKEPATKTSEGIWREVREGSTYIKGEVESEQGAKPTLALVAPPTNSVTLHVWSDDSAAVVVTNSTDESAWYDVVMNLNKDGTLKATNRVLDVKIQAGQTSVPFEIFGVESNKTANLILSASTNYTYNSTGIRYDDYVSVPVKCVEKKTKSRYVKATVDDGLKTVNVSTNYEDAVGTITVAVATGYTNDLTVTVTPRLRDGATAWSNYVHLADHEDTSPGKWSTLTPFTYTIKKDAISSETVEELHQTIDIFAMGADTHTSLASAGIVFDVTLDEKGAEYYGTPKSDSILYFKPTAPVILTPAQGEVLKGTGNTQKAFEITVADSYLNTCNTNVGYTIWYKRKASQSDYAQLKGTGTWALDAYGVLRDREGRGSMPSILYVSAGTYETEFYLVAPDGVTRSALRQVTVEVSEPATVWMETKLADAEGNEGTNVNITVYLSEPADNDGKAVYAFLVPSDEASSNLVDCAYLAKAGNKGVKILAGATKSTMTAKIKFLDGESEGTQLGYDIVLCKQQTYPSTWDDTTYGDYFVSGFQSETYTPTIHNVQPHVTIAKMRGKEATASSWYTVKESGQTIGTAAVGVVKEFQFSVFEPGSVDLSITNDGKRFELQYNIQESNGAGESKTLYGDPAKTNFTYTFTAVGTARIGVQVRDKDMKDSDSWSDEFVFFVEVTDHPTISIASESGDFTFREDNLGARATAMQLTLSANTATIPLDVEVTVKSAASGQANPGLLELGGLDKTTTAGVYTVTFAKGQTSQKIYVDDGDGTKLSMTKGFIVTSRVTTHVKNPDGIYYDEFYTSEPTYFFVENAAPSISTSLGEENSSTNGIHVAIGDGEPISWSVDDIAHDLGSWDDRSKTTNIYVKWMSDGRSVETNVYDSTNTYYFTPKFTVSGTRTVTVTVTDKDKDSGTGTTTLTWYYEVEAAKILVTTPVGPSAGKTSIADRYHSLAGCGEGHIYVSDATFQSASMFNLNWNCKLSTDAELYAWGYKAGAYDNGDLDGGNDQALLPSGKDAPSGTAKGSCYHYTDSRDSFLYLWVKYGASETTTSSGGSSSSTSEDTATIAKIAMETWDGVSYAKTGSYSPSLPTAATDGTYPKTYVEAIFSKEYLISDNMGDINQDGLPDLYVKKYKFDVFESADTFEIVGDDTARLDNYNEDGDYLPGKESAVYTYFVPTSTNGVETPVGTAFTAVQELRGGYQDTTAWSGLNDACDQTYASIAGVKVDRIYCDPATCPTSTLTKLEWAGFKHWCELNGRSVTDKTAWNAWSPECPTDPTLEDTDGDLLSDGYEYYYWYRAHVGYMEGTNHVFMTGRRFNPKHPLEPVEISPDEIAAAMNPQVKNDQDLDTDNDGLSNLEEATLGTNPFDFDSDGDGLPDGYEVGVSLTSPLIYATNGATCDALLNADGDAMACRMFEKDGSVDNRWYVVPVEGGYICSPTEITVEAERIVPTDGQAIYTAWLYSGTTGSVDAVYCRGRQYFCTDTYTSLAVTGEPALETLRVAHFHVYQMFGFDPRTGWQAGGIRGHYKDSTSFTVRDEFLLQAFFYHAGGLLDSELVPTVGKTMTALWLEQTTCPCRERTLEATDTTAAAETTTYGADTDADAMPDGWELYLMAGVETAPQTPTVATDTALKALCRPSSYYSPLSDYNKISDPTIYNVNSAASVDVAKDSLRWPEEYSGCESYAVYTNTCPTIVNQHPAWQNKWWPTDPWNSDTDGDGLSDSTEGSTFIYGSNTHADPTTEYYEDCVAGGGLNPCSWDTDCDGLPDPWESEFAGSYDAGSSETSVTVAEDGTTNRTVTVNGAGWEENGMDGTVDDYMKDYDHDGLANWQEYLVGAMRCWRYDDTVSRWTSHETPLPNDAGKLAAGTLTDDDLYNMLFNPASADYNPGFRNRHFNPGAYMSCAKNDFEQGNLGVIKYINKRCASVYGHFYLFKDGIDHDLSTDFSYSMDGDNRFTVGVTEKGFSCHDAMTGKGLYPRSYITCDPRLPDTDYDGLDDYYELCHGLNPLLGADRQRTEFGVTPPRDVVFEAYYHDLKAPNPWSSEYNHWLAAGDVMHLTRPERPLAVKGATESIYDFFQFPWLAGLATADPDGDNIRNQQEGIMANLQAAATYLHTDPTPLWMTDTSYEDSLVTRYYQVKDPDWASSRSVTSFDWSGETITTTAGGTYSLLDCPWLEPIYDTAGAITGYTVAYDDAFNYWRIKSDLFDYEEDEGYDSDHDYLSDFEEGQGKTKNASDPQYHDDPLRRQAMWFGGDDDKGFLQTPTPVRENVPTTSSAAEQRQNFLYFTVECWAKADASIVESETLRTLVERAIWTGPANAADESYLRKNFLIGLKGGRWYAKFDSTGTDKLQPVEILDGPAASTNWTHVAATYDGTALKLFVNGILRSTHATTIQPEHGISAVAVNEAGEMAEDGTLSWHGAEMISILVGASATTRYGVVFDYQWQNRDVAYVTDANPLGLAPRRTKMSLDYGNFFNGYIDEVRVWDGARTASSILADYESRTRYTSALAQENRESVYAQWKNGARRSPAASTQLTAELMYHWSFDHVTGAVDPAEVVPQPAGFSTSKPVTDAMAPWARPEGWTNCWRVAIDDSLKSSVYGELAWIPWIADTVGHLPRYDQTTLDSLYWSADYAGITPAAAAGSGYTSFTFPRSAELPSRRHQMRYSVGTGAENDPYVINTRWELVKSLAGSNNVIDVTNPMCTAYKFAHRNRELEGFDLLPFGSAFPKRISAAEGGLWDAKASETVSAADAWAQTGEDSNNDGLPDWWTQYALENYNVSTDPTATITWDTTVKYKGSLMPAWRAYLRDLSKGMHVENGAIVVTDANFADVRDADKDGLPDWWEEQWKLDTTVANADDDPDHDGLSNYQEYLLSEKYPSDYQLATKYPGVTVWNLSPNLDHSTTNAVTDYYLKYSNVPTNVTPEVAHFFLNEYFGEMVTDHDFIEDWWENLYDLSYTSAKKYDPLQDADGDGWSTWAECRSSLWGNSFTASLISKWTGSDSSQYVICRPQPIVGVMVSYYGAQDVAGKQLVVRATSGQTARMDATFVVPSTLEGRTKFIGGFEGNSVLHGHMSPGMLNVNSIMFDRSRVTSEKVYTWNCDWYKQNQASDWGWDEDPSDRDGNYYLWSNCSRTHSGDFETYKSEYQKWPKIELEGGDFVWESFVQTVPSADLASAKLLIDGVTEFGWVDCTTGEYELDMSKFSGEGTVDEYVFRVSYTSRLGNDWPQTVYLSDTKEFDATNANTQAEGYVREGRNTIEAFVDLNADGVFTEGEPFGSVRNVMVGWHKVPVVTIELHDDSPIMPCVAISASSSDSKSSGDSKSVTTTASSISKTARVTRRLINGLNLNEGKRLIERVLVTKEVVLDDHAYLTEADVVKIAKPDLDWTWLKKDASKFGIENIETVTYSVDEVQTLADGSSTNITLATFVKEFPSTRSVATVVSPVASAPVYAASPTFTFAASDDRSTGYLLEIRQKDGATVYSSGARLLPGRTSGTDGQHVYSVTPPVFAGMPVYSGTTTNHLVFADGSNYQWRVTLLNAKYTDKDLEESDYSKWADFQMDIRNQNRYPRLSTGYGIVGLAVRYYGPTNIPPTGIVVEAFENADFSGQPLAQARLTDDGLFRSQADLTTVNVRFWGVSPGKRFFRAYFDQNGNGIRDRWESWGYANCVGESVTAIYNPKDIEVTASAANITLSARSEYHIFIEDCDINQNEYPDCKDPKFDRDANADQPYWEEPESSSSTTTDPMIDTDGDGMPDVWENWNDGITDPLVADGETLPEGEMDAMAYREETWQMVTIDDGSADGLRYLAKGGSIDPRDGLLASNYVFTSFYLYGPSTAAGQIYGVGTNVVVTNAWPIKSVGDVTVALVHGQVYAQEGYNTLTANAQALLSGDAVDTKAFTALDRYLVLRYFEAIGVAVAPAGYKSFEEYAMKSGEGVWSKWTLKPGTTDANNDFVADGWQLYVMYGNDLEVGGEMAAGDRGNTSPWGSTTETTAKTPGGEGLSWRQEYDNGTLPTNPYSRDTAGDGVMDNYAYLYHLKGDEAGQDRDGDGLSNYAEYLISEVFQYTKLDPDDPKTDGSCVDYFRKMGELYFGEIFTDHDQVDDLWEESFGPAYANRYAYDPSLDADGDGWSNYAEAKAGTSPARESVVGVDGYVYSEHPVPVIEAAVTYNGILKGITSKLVFKAWNEKTDADMTGAPDAIWTFETPTADSGNADSSESSTATSTKSRVKYLGQNPCATRTFVLGPGAVSPGTVKVYFRDQAWKYAAVVDGTETAVYQGDSASAKWYPLVQDSNGALVTCVTNEAAVTVGTVDYTTGRITLWLGSDALTGSVYASIVNAAADNTTDSTDSNVISKYYNCEKLNLAESYVKVGWTSIVVGTTVGGTYFLGDADAISSEPAKMSGGYVREGKTRFVVFADRDGDGEYSAGEPFGFVQGVDVGWQGASFKVDLTDTHPTFARMFFAGSKACSCDRTYLQAMNDTLSSNRYAVSTAPVSEGGYVRVRVVRTAVNGKAMTEMKESDVSSQYAPQTVVLDKTFNTNIRAYLHEGDFLGGSKSLLIDSVPDIDWDTLASDAQKYATWGWPNNLTSVTYRVIFGDGALGLSATNPPTFKYMVDRRFDTDLASAYSDYVPTPELSEDVITYNTRPTFRWYVSDGSHNFNSYTAFKLQVLAANGATVLYDSGYQPMPRYETVDNIRHYVWQAPSIVDNLSTCCGRIERNGNYRWRVTIYNSKYKSGRTSSSTRLLTTKVNVTQDINDHQYSAIPVCVKYTGPESVLAKAQNTATLLGKVRIQAFASADYSGAPVSEAIATDDLADTTKTLANAKLYGLDQGCSYYLRAYIDSNGNLKKDDWESWGAAKALVAAGETTPTGIYIEDADTDGDWLPDAYEFAIAGWDEDENWLDREEHKRCSGKFIVNADLYDSVRNNTLTAGVSTGMSGAPLTVFTYDMVAGLVCGSPVYSVSTVDDIRRVVEKKVQTGTLRITSITLDPKGGKVVLGVAAETAQTIAGKTISQIYDFDTTATVKVRIYKKDSLVAKSWGSPLTHVDADPTSPTYGQEIDYYPVKIESNLSSLVEVSVSGVDMSSGFYNVEVEQ